MFVCTASIQVSNSISSLSLYGSGNAYITLSTRSGHMTPTEVAYPIPIEIGLEMNN